MTSFLSSKAFTFFLMFKRVISTVDLLVDYDRRHGGRIQIIYSRSTHCFFSRYQKWSFFAVGFLDFGQRKVHAKKILGKLRAHELESFNMFEKHPKWVFVLDFVQNPQRLGYEFLFCISTPEFLVEVSKHELDISTYEFIEASPRFWKEDGNGHFHIRSVSDFRFVFFPGFRWFLFVKTYLLMRC